MRQHALIRGPHAVPAFDGDEGTRVLAAVSAAKKFSCTLLRVWSAVLPTVYTRSEPAITCHSPAHVEWRTYPIAPPEIRSRSTWGQKSLPWRTLDQCSARMIAIQPARAGSGVDGAEAAAASAFGTGTGTGFAAAGGRPGAVTARGGGLDAGAGDAAVAVLALLVERACSAVASFRQVSTGSENREPVRHEEAEQSAYEDLWPTCSRSHRHAF